MLVKCLSNKTHIAGYEGYSAQIAEHTTNENWSDLEVGQVYVAYGLWFRWGLFGYFLLPDEQMWYPDWYPVQNFEVLSGEASKYWRLSASLGQGLAESYIKLVFPEWASDDYFYDRLTDGVEADVRLWEKYRRLMDEEAIPALSSDFPKAQYPSVDAEDSIQE